MKILLFKTSISTTSDKNRVAEILKQYKGISTWHIDFERKHKPLRIQGYGVTTQQIIQSIQEAGYQCSEASIDEF